MGIPALKEKRGACGPGGSRQAADGGAADDNLALQGGGPLDSRRIGSRPADLVMDAWVCGALGLLVGEVVSPPSAAEPVVFSVWCSWLGRFGVHLSRFLRSPSMS